MYVGRLQSVHSTSFRTISSRMAKCSAKENRRDKPIAPAVLQIYYVCLGPKSCIESPHCMTEKIRKPTKNITNKIMRV